MLSMSFIAIDVYAKLVFSILKGSSKLFLLSKILAVTVRFIVKDAEEKKISFNPRPFSRLFINWLLDLGSLEPVTDGANLQVFVTFIYPSLLSFYFGYKHGVKAFSPLVYILEWS
ncbi:unnamed protein product [Lathyrus sativus]|nr:unnamed protein product [Lathyrus sativus]